MAFDPLFPRLDPRDLRSVPRSAGRSARFRHSRPAAPALFAALRLTRGLDRRSSEAFRAQRPLYARRNRGNRRGAGETGLGVSAAVEVSREANGADR